MKTDSYSHEDGTLFERRRGDVVVNLTVLWYDVPGGRRGVPRLGLRMTGGGCLMYVVVVAGGGDERAGVDEAI